LKSLAASNSHTTRASGDTLFGKESIAYANSSQSVSIDLPKQTLLENAAE
jgi:hypothetical protein